MSFSLGTPPHTPSSLPAWTLRHLRIVERAIVVAWSQLISTQDFNLWAGSAIERDITLALQRQLVELLNTCEVKGFTPAAFAAPIRGQELENYTGEEKEKRPDLSFIRLASRPVSNHNAQFYECKIIGRGRSVDDYHKDGIMRFVDGRYAWAMPHAGMIAYVSPPPACIASTVLASYWEHCQANPSLGGMPTCDLEHDTSLTTPILITVHSRNLPASNLGAPPAITLRHLWLPVSPDA